MRHYHCNSPEAAGRILAACLLSDGHLGLTELEALDRCVVERDFACSARVVVRHGGEYTRLMLSAARFLAVSLGLVLAGCSQAPLDTAPVGLVVDLLDLEFDRCRHQEETLIRSEFFIALSIIARVGSTECRRAS